MKILFVYQGLQSFVQKDLDILRSIHEVHLIQFSGRKELIKHIFPNLWRLWQGILWCDLTFSWFGKLHAFFAVLFSKIVGKKAIVVAGGDDVADGKVEGKPYGLYACPLKRCLPNFVFRNADLVLAISQSNFQETLRNTQIELGKLRLLYHGFDPIVFASSEEKITKGLVVTISEVTSETVHLKGLKLFIQSAKYLPHVHFALVGPWKDCSIKQLQDIASPNVEFTGALYGRELVQFLQKSNVYVQASLYESFGCAIAEAMLCECVPVVSRSQSIPEVVGDCGIYLDELTPKELARKIQEAQNRPELGKMARERIVKLFPLQKRAQELLHAIEEVRKM